MAVLEGGLGGLEPPLTDFNSENEQRGDPLRFLIKIIPDIGIASSHSLTKEEKYFLLTDDLLPPANFQ